ncbi:MAG: hypothetical protein Q9227_002144 [Pyrenula ochraceoflavens]
MNTSSSPGEEGDSTKFTNIEKPIDTIPSDQHPLEDRGKSSPTSAVATNTTSTELSLPTLNIVEPTPTEPTFAKSFEVEAPPVHASATQAPEDGVAQEADSGTDGHGEVPSKVASTVTAPPEPPYAESLPEPTDNAATSTKPGAPVDVPITSAHGEIVPRSPPPLINEDLVSAEAPPATDRPAPTQDPIPPEVSATTTTVQSLPDSVLAENAPPERTGVDDASAKPTSNEETGADPLEPEVIDQTLVVDSRSVSSESDYLTDADRQSITTSLSSTITDFEFSHGRRYHAFGENVYWLPNDATEISRLDIQHHVWRLSLNGALHIAPLAPPIDGHVLDIGTGTGRWALDFAEEHPQSTVLGTDLSPIQPPYVPENCSFLIDNAESDWIFDSPFDFIHSRMLIMGIHDWPRFFRQAFDNLRPGGWLEVKEPQFPIICVDDSATAESPLMAFSQGVREASARAGIDTMIVHQFKDFLEAQGFVNIRMEPVKWPVGPWPKGEALKNIGRWMVPDTKEFVKPAAMKLFTTSLGWSQERVEGFVEDVLRDIDDRKTHYHWLLVSSRNSSGKSRLFD